MNRGVVHVSDSMGVFFLLLSFFFLAYYYYFFYFSWVRDPLAFALFIICIEYFIMYSNKMLKYVNHSAVLTKAPVLLRILALGFDIFFSV